MSRFGTAYAALAMTDLFWQFGETAVFDPDGAAAAVTVIVYPDMSVGGLDTDGEYDSRRLTILAPSAAIAAPNKGDMETQADEWQVRSQRWFVADCESQVDKGLYRIELLARDRDKITREDVRSE